MCPKHFHLPYHWHLLITAILIHHRRRKKIWHSIWLTPWKPSSLFSGKYLFRCHHDCPEIRQNFHQPHHNQEKLHNVDNPCYFPFRHKSQNIFTVIILICQLFISATDTIVDCWYVADESLIISTKTCLLLRRRWRSAIVIIIIKTLYASYWVVAHNLWVHPPTCENCRTSEMSC